MRFSGMPIPGVRPRKPETVSRSNATHEGMLLEQGCNHHHSHELTRNLHSEDFS